MQLLFAAVSAVALGVVLSAALPNRAWTGALLLPAIAGAACCVVWVALTWARVEQGGALMWLTSLACAVLSAAGVGVPLRRARRRAEERRLAAVA